MSITLSPDIQSWLIQLQVISDSTTGQPLPPQTQGYLFNGILFAKLALQLSKMFPSQFTAQLTSMEALKDGNSPAIKVYNWNLVKTAFKKLGIEINDDMKQLIIAGDGQIVEELLKDVKQQAVQKVQKSGQQPSGIGEESVLNLKNISSISNDNSIIKLQKKLRPRSNFNNSLVTEFIDQQDKETIDISKINVNKDIMKIESVLELLIVLLSKHLSLKPKQAASLFTRNNKYLAHVIAKGVRAEFDPIISFYQECYQYVSHITAILSQDQSNQIINFTLQAIKPGFLSKNREVSEWTCRVFQQFGFEFASRDMLHTAYAWFIEENQGILACLLGLKRHPELSHLILHVILQFCSHNFSYVMIEQIRKNQNDDKEFLYTINQLLKPLIENDMTKEDEYQIDGFHLHLKLPNQNISFPMKQGFHLQVKFFNYFEFIFVKIAFIVEVWLQFPYKIEDSEQKVNDIIQILKKGTKTQCNTMIFSCLTLLFRLLNEFGINKNQYAPNIYKQLTLILIENFPIVQIREFIMINFINVFENLDSIPLAILVKPLIKQIQVSQNDIYLLNIPDFHFFLFLAKNDKLDANLGIQLLDLLAKIYLNNLVFAPVTKLNIFIQLLVQKKLSAQSILTIISRYIDDEQLQEFVIKFAKISLAIYYASEKKKKPKGKMQPMYNSKPATMGPQLSLQEMEIEVMNSQKRALIVEILLQIINLKCQPVNDKVLTMVAYTNIQIKHFSKQYNKGMLAILQLFGNVQDLLEKYEKEYNEKYIASKQNKLDEGKEMESQLLESRDLGDLNQSQDKNSPMDKKLMDQYGIGLKKKNYLTKLSKAEQSKLSFLKNPRVSPKVLKEIKESNRRNYLMRKEQEEQEQAQKNQLIERKKQKLREQLQKRSIEQGVATLNQKDVPTENNLFDFGSREAQIEKERKHGLIEFEPIDLDLEEERDKKMVEIFLNKNRKIFHHLFVKYSNQGLKLKVDSFDKYQKTSSVITPAELFKLFKEHDFQQFLNQLQLSSIIRETQVKIFKNKADCHDLTFEQYLNVVMQVSSFAYPHLQHMPVSFSLQELLQHFRQADERRGINTILYDDPEAAVFGDSDVIKEFNKQLKENPDYQLPEGFNKQYSKNVEFNYAFPEAFLKKISPNFNMIYSLVNDILIENFQINLVEPLSKEVTEVKARPTGKAGILPQGYNPENYFKPLQKKIDEKEKERQYDIEYWMKQAKILRQPQNQQSDKRRVLEINHYRPLSFALKMEVAKASAKDKFTAQEVAQVMEDLLEAVEYQRDFIVAPGEVVNKKKKNEALKQKDEQDKIAKVKEEKKEKERQQYLEKLRTEYSKLTEEKKKEEDERKTRIREDRMKQKQEKKKYLEQLKADQEEKERMKQVDEQQRHKEMKKKEETENMMRREERLKKKEEFEEFNEKKIEQYQKANAVKLERLKEEQASKPTVEKELVKIKQYREKVLPKHIVQNKVMKQQYLDREKKIQEVFENESIQTFFRKYEHHLVDLFDVLINETYTPINFRGRRDTIPITVLYEFVNLFNITPTCVKLLDISNIYHTLAKDKPYIDNIEIGLDFEEFLNFILRIAIKGIKVFNKIALKLSKYQVDKYESTEDFEKLQMSALDITQVHQQENEEQFDQSVAQVEEILKQQPEKRMENNKEDYKFETQVIDQVNQYTLYAFFYYCGFSFDPRDNNSVLRRFKQKKEIPHMPNRKKKIQMLATLDKNVLENLVSPTKDLLPQMKKQLINASKVNQSKILPDEVQNQDHDQEDPLNESSEKIPNQ